jgi:hypothetical protein
MTPPRHAKGGIADLKGRFNNAYKKENSALLKVTSAPKNGIGFAVNQHTGIV